MRLRMLSLLVVAVASGTLVSLADSASTGKPRALAAPTASAGSTLCPVSALYRADFRRAAADTALPIAMIVAVAKVESNLKVNACSAAGAHGLLQVLPSTVAELKLDPYQAGENVLAGALTRPSPMSQG